MSERGNCCGKQGSLPVDTEPTESPPNNNQDGGSANFEPRLKGGCPEFTPCSGKAAIPKQEPVIEKGDGDYKLVLEQVKNMQPAGPLGQIPVEPGEDIPLEYWTPLAGLTKTRPAVDKFSLSRFSPSELTAHNEKVSTESSDRVQIAAVAGYNAHCSVSRSYAVADKNQMDNNMRLNTRAGIIHRWRTELERTISEIGKEINFVQEIRRRTMRAKAVLKLIENISKDMIRVRCFRVDTDLVRDKLAEEILKELSLCEEVKDLYVRMLDQLKMQIEELKTAKQRLEFDLSDKTEAYEIDSDSRGLTSESNNILWKPGATRIPPEYILELPTIRRFLSHGAANTPDIGNSMNKYVTRVAYISGVFTIPMGRFREYSRQSSTSSYEFSIRQIIAEGQTAIERSSTLIINVDSMIEKAVRDIRDQGDRVDLHLMEQIQHHEQSVRRLEVEMNKNLHQLSDTETLIDEIRKASNNLDGTMKCAQTRLDKRLIRHGVENCRDIPQFGLIEEVKSISDNVTANLGQMKRLEDSTIGLMQTRKTIEKELLIKRKSLYVDRERCQKLRNFYPSFQALAGN